METSLKLYGYWRSSAAYRVRICLNLKQLRYENHSIHLVKNGGEQHLAHYHALNPNELVPVLVDGDLVLNQSLAIIQYLDDNYSSTQVIPSMGPLRYQALALAQDIAIDVHPLNNLRVLQYLEGSLEVDEEQKRCGYITGSTQALKRWKKNSWLTVNTMVSVFLASVLVQVSSIYVWSLRCITRSVLA